MKKSITLLVLSLAIIFAFAQEENNVKNQVAVQPNQIVPQAVEVNTSLSELNAGGGGYVECFYYGDPSGMFFNEEWEAGKANLLDGSVLEGEYRYNLYKQKMQAIIDGDTFAFAKPCELESLQLGDHKFVYATYIRPDREVASTWFEVLCEGDCSLLLRRYIKYRVSDGDGDPTNDQLYKLEEYYVKNEGNPERMYLTKKSVLENMSDHESEVASFMKENKIKLKEQEDLLKVIAYYNSLE